MPEGATNYLSTGLQVHERKTTHLVDHSPPDAPPERPHDNVLSYSHPTPQPGCCRAREVCYNTPREVGQTTAGPTGRPVRP